MKLALLNLYPIVFLFLLSCSNPDETLIEGHWRASDVFEENVRLEIDLSDVSFTFQDSHYSYFNTAHLEENGLFEIHGDKLVVRDTAKQMDLKKSVQITMLTKDSLHLRMNAGGKEQLLKLFRAGIEDEEAPIIME